MPAGTALICPDDSDRGDRVYGHVARESGQRWLQYWFFYYFNPQEFAGEGVHEGDGEMIQIRLDEDLEPVHATYAKHNGGGNRSWSDVEKTADGRPIVYVAARSHASYFEAGSNIRAPRPPRLRGGAVPTLSPGV